MWKRISLLLVLLSPVAEAQEIGYALVYARGRDNVQTSARGFELRLNVGGDRRPERYSRDRWSFALGAINAREPHIDNWVDTPAGELAYVDDIDGLMYASFTHRWYTKYSRFRKFPDIRLFVGTGFGWRDAVTCVYRSERKEDEYCFDGTLEVSSRIVFHQSLGIKWRERIEVAWEHGSTGKISRLNHGEDMLRFSIMAFIW